MTYSSAYDPKGCPYKGRKILAKKTGIYELAMQRRSRSGGKGRKKLAVGTKNQKRSSRNFADICKPMRTRDTITFTRIASAALPRWRVGRMSDGGSSKRSPPT